MKKTNKILAIMLVIVLAITVMPIVSNAYTVTISNNTPSSDSSTYEVYEILKNTGTKDNPVYELTANATGYFSTNVTATVGTDEPKYLTTVDEVLEYLTDLSKGSEGVIYNIATVNDFAKDYREKVNPDQTAATSPITVTDLGYYLIYDENGDPRSQNLLKEINEDNMTFNVKAIGVEVEKEATNGNSHYIGETVDYTIKTAVPNMSGYSAYEFVITDTPTNLDITEGTVEVSIDGVQVTLPNEKISVENNVLTVDLGEYLFDNKATLQTGDVILVTYDAVLLKEALPTSEAYNNVKIEYSNDPNVVASTGEVTDEDKVYTYTVEFNKKSLLGKDLTGAEFVLKDATDKYIKIATDGTKVVSLVDNEIDATTFIGGTFSIEGLKEGTYELVEIKAPTDYSIVEGLKFTITNNDNSTIGTAEPALITHTFAKAQDASKYISIVEGSNLNGFEADIINSKTTLLPGTGGIGTTIFTIVGISLMAGAVVTLVVVNRKNK